MSNIKQIRITGQLPFNCYETPELQPYLAQMNCPTIGIRIEWGNCTMIPNSYGGQTATYDFVISGEEAVRLGWIEGLKQGIDEAGGNVKSIFVKDIEENRVLLNR